MRVAPRDRPTLVLSILLFAIGFGGGLLVESSALASGTDQFGRRSVWFFFSRNVYVAFVLFAGALTFGVVTGMTLFYNGFVVGYALSNSGRELVTTLLLVLPHGVVELPAFWLAGAAGFTVPYGLVRYLAGDRESMLTYDDLSESAWQFALACGLLLVAAVLESTVTPVVANLG